MASSSNPRGAKPGNARRTSSKQRRRSDSDVLEVNVRTRHALRLRKEKLLGVTSKLLLVVAAGAALYFAGRKVITSQLVKNPDYNVTELNVQTDGALPRETVLEMADIQKGSNIFFVNLDRAKARIEAMPQVEHAQVSKQLPNRIMIQVNERKPVAWVAPERNPAKREGVIASPESHLIDAHGILLPAKNAQPQERFLPIIRNYSGGPRSDGQEAEGEEIKAALDLLHAQQDSMIAARFQIQEIDLGKHFGLEVTDRNGLQVLFGLDDMERQLRRLRDNLLVLDESPAKPQTINLLVQKNVPVTFVTEPVASTPAIVPTSVATVMPPGTGKSAVVTAKTTTTGKDAIKHHPDPKLTDRKKHDQKSHDQKTRRGPQPFGATP